MSVLKNKRTESKAEYVNTAYHLYIEILNFLSRLSARYSRLLTDQIMRLTSEVLEFCEKANSMVPTSEQRYNLRTEYLLRARGSLLALDIQLSVCYGVMMLNPAGCFTTSNGGSVDSSKAKKKLEHLAQEIGELIDKENNFIKSVMKSDKDKFKNLKKEE